MYEKLRLSTVITNFFKKSDKLPVSIWCIHDLTLLELHCAWWNKMAACVNVCQQVYELHLQCSNLNYKVVANKIFEAEV